MQNKPYPLYDIKYVPDIRTLIIERAEQEPKAICFQYMEKGRVISKTFADVKNDVAALCNELISKEYNNSNIAIIGSNSYEWLIAYFAIVCSGNIAVPIDSQLSSDTLIELLSEANCKAAFTTDLIRRKISENVNLPLFSLSSVFELSARKSDDLLANNEIIPDNPSTIFFTSGTTGKKKAVILSHKNIATDIFASCRNFRLSGDTLSILPYHHSFGLIAAVLMVMNYGKKIFISHGQRCLRQEFLIAKPQTVFAVPLYAEAFYKLILQAEKQGKTAQQIFGGKLEYFICGGAPFHEFYYNEYKSRGILILNGYGITECSPVVAVNRNEYQKVGSVGQILECCSVKVDIDGEILITGDNVMINYFTDEDETVFRDGYFCTGDLGYIDDENYLYITGRKKNLIILSNGENVSPEEIEMQLMDDRAIAEVVVYSDNGHLVSEIYPDSNYLQNVNYFNELIAKYNLGKPMYYQISELRLRSEPFRKNASGKIIRKGIGVL